MCILVMCLMLLYTSGSHVRYMHCVLRHGRLQATHQAEYEHLLPPGCPWPPAGAGCS